MSWNWWECRFLVKNVPRSEESGYGKGAVYDKCGVSLITDDECSYPTVYRGKEGWECGTYKLVRLAKKTKKRERTSSAYD